MENEMVERVVKALVGALGDAVICDDGNLFVVDGEVDPVALARAAIEAMREPTAGMVQAGNRKSMDDGLIEAGCIEIADELPPIFTAMIDAALVPPENPTERHPDNHPDHLS